MTRPSKPRLVRIIPVPGRFLTGVPAIEQEVPKERAEELIATAAFEPATPEQPEPDPVEDLD